MGCSSSKDSGMEMLRDEAKESFRTNKYPLYGPESIMDRKGHGTYSQPVQSNLRWGVDEKLADRICNYNRNYTEHLFYYKGKKAFMEELEQSKNENKRMRFYDSNTGLQLFEAPVGRTWDEFLEELTTNGLPTFRDKEVVWGNVRCMRGGETVSLAGTHLGHNIHDADANNCYRINLVSISGNPVEDQTAAPSEDGEAAEAAS